MRFVVLLGFLLISARIAPYATEETENLVVMLVVMILMDLTDFVMNIIKTFRK